MICFVHIEKAGGTTIHHIFRNNFLSYMSLTPWQVWTNEEQNCFRESELKVLCKIFPYTSGFGGHTIRPFIDYEAACEKKIDYITFLRDPVKRYVSHFNHQTITLKRGWSIERFMSDPRFDNFMTKKICGNTDVEIAKKILKEKFDFVGLVEEFDASLLLLKNELNLNRFKCFYEPRNITETKSESEKTYFSDHLLEKVRDKNKLDIELYEFAKQELFPAYRDNYKGDLDSDLENFQQKNKGYKFSRSRRLIWAGYRYLTYRNIEYLLNRIYH